MKQFVRRTGDGASCKVLYHILCFSTRGRFHFSAFAAALCRLLQPAICEKPIFFIITTNTPILLRFCYTIYGKYRIE